MRPSSTNNNKIRFLILFLVGCSCQLDMVRCFPIPSPSSITTVILRETANSSGGAEESSSSTSHPPSSQSCPFSKSFPRYRIDLSRTKENTETSWFAAPFKNISRFMQKSKLEQQLLLSSRRNNNNNKVVLIWEPELDGIAAFSFLWDRAAQIINNENGSQEEEEEEEEVIALPDASRRLVQNWVEIIDWMATNSIPNQMDRVLEATLIESSDGDDDSIPAVRIRRIGTLPTRSQLSTTTTTSVEILNQRTLAWVKRILVEQGICPFTKSVRKSGQGLSDVGVPVGAISYHGTSATHPITLFADTWKAILDMIQAGPSGKEGISSILLTAPEFDDDFDFWAGPIFAMLEAGVIAAQAQAEIGVVCFHPRYATPDGKSWPGFGHMHSVPRLQKWYQANAAPESSSSLTTEDVAAGGAWQRRTPHATINVLRADQLEAAESKRTSGTMYTENIEKLVGTKGIGSDQLAKDLERERQLGNAEL